MRFPHYNAFNEKKNMNAVFSVHVDSYNWFSICWHRGPSLLLFRASFSLGQLSLVSVLK